MADEAGANLLVPSFMPVVDGWRRQSQPSPEHPKGQSVLVQSVLSANQKGRSKNCCRRSSSKNPRRQGPVLVDQEMLCSGPWSAGGDLGPRTGHGFGSVDDPIGRGLLPDHARGISRLLPVAQVRASASLSPISSISFDLSPELISSRFPGKTTNHPDFVVTADGCQSG